MYRALDIQKRVELVSIPFAGYRTQSVFLLFDQQALCVCVLAVPA